MGMGTVRHARPQFEALLESATSVAHALRTRQIAESKGDKTQAIAEYRLALKLEPTLAEATLPCRD